MRFWKGQGKAASAVLLLLLGDALLLAAVAFNRFGEPTSTLVLTERELAMPRVEPGESRNADDTRLALRLRFYPHHSRKAAPTYDWLDDAKLAELGFREPPALPRGSSRRERSLYNARGRPRAAYLVIESSAESWRLQLDAEEEHLHGKRQDVSSEQKTQRTADASKKRLELVRVMGSRLFCVDAGRDPELLRRSYPDRERHTLIPGFIERQVVLDEDGSITEVLGTCRPLVDRLSVPAELRPVLDRIPPKIGLDFLLWKLRHEDKSEEQEEIEPYPPRYEAVVAIGRRYEPWLVEVRRFEPGDPM